MKIQVGGGTAPPCPPLPTPIPEDQKQRNMCHRRHKSMENM